MGHEAEETAPELKALAAAYGECLWDWSCIETELFGVFMAASALHLSIHLEDIERPMTLEDIERQESLRRTFFAVKGIEIRLAMTHALAQQRWEKSPHLATWKTIHAELDKQRRVRGKIGHRIGILYLDPDASKPPLAVLIDPILHDTDLSYQDVKNRGIPLVKLIEIHRDFLLLRKRIAEFLLTLAQEQITLAQEQHGAFVQPQAGQPHPPHAQYDQIPKESP